MYWKIRRKGCFPQYNERGEIIDEKMQNYGDENDVL